MKVQKQQQENSKKSVEDNYAEIISEVNTGIANPKGKRIVVEFFDYNCGYCKMASKNVKEFLVFKITWSIKSNASILYNCILSL